MGIGIMRTGLRLTVGILGSSSLMVSIFNRSRTPKPNGYCWIMNNELWDEIMEVIIVNGILTPILISALEMYIYATYVCMHTWCSCQFVLDLVELCFENSVSFCCLYLTVDCWQPFFQISMVIKWDYREELKMETCYCTCFPALPHA